MSINLGTEAIEAIERLKISPDFAKLRVAMGDLAHHHMHLALDATPELRNEACARARAMRDMWIAFEGAARNLRPQQMDKKELHVGRPVPRGGKGALPTGTFAGADMVADAGAELLA